MLYNYLTQVPAFLALSLFIYLILEMLRIRYRYRIGRRIASAVIPFQRVIVGAKNRVLIAGDSSAVGTGALDNRKTIAGRLAELFPETSIENIGKNGMNTERLISKIRGLPIEPTYDLIILNIGGNDIVFFSALDDVGVQIYNLLIEAKLRAKKVILWSGGNAGSIPAIPWILRGYFDRRSKQLRQAFMAAAKKCGVFYVDLYRTRELDPLYHDPKRYVGLDRFHPSDDGYGLWVEELLKVFREEDIKLT